MVPCRRGGAPHATGSSPVPGSRTSVRRPCRGVALSFSQPRPVAHRTIVRKVIPYGGRHYHVANLRSPEDLDAQLRDWLTQAYLDSPE